MAGWVAIKLTPLTFGNSTSIRVIVLDEVLSLFVEHLA